MEMDVALHVGTLLAVVLYFWRDLWAMITHVLTYCLKGFKTTNYDNTVRLAFSLVVATIPAVIVGFLLKRIGLDEVRQVSLIALTSILFALVLFITDYFGSKSKDIKDITLLRGLLIGLGQAIALIPGVSRSGICISVALALGFTRTSAARFAFLMSIPSIIGAATLTAYDIVNEEIPIVWANIGLGILFSALAGLAAIHFMLKFLNRHSLNIFVIYRILLGIAIWYLL
jgi:undecaprenyl-diphosphatase